MTSIETLTFTPEPRSEKSMDNDRPAPKKVKIIIKVKRDSDFFSKVKAEDL